MDERSRKACIAIIAEGGAVDAESAARELSRASALSIAFLQDRIVGVGAIKRARPDYAAHISGESGVAFPAETLELGYVSVAKDHQGRGLSWRVVAPLIAPATGPLIRHNG